MKPTDRVFIAGHRGLLDCSRLRALGWSAKISFRKGVESTYRWFQNRVVGDSTSDAIRL